MNTKLGGREQSKEEAEGDSSHERMHISMKSCKHPFFVVVGQEFRKSYHPLSEGQEIKSEEKSENYITNADTFSSLVLKHVAI